MKHLVVIPSIAHNLNWHAEMMLYKNINTRLYLTMAWRRGVSSGGLLTSGLALIKRRKSRHCR